MTGLNKINLPTHSRSASTEAEPSILSLCTRSLILSDEITNHTRYIQIVPLPQLSNMGDWFRMIAIIIDWFDGSEMVPFEWTVLHFLEDSSGSDANEDDQIVV